MIIINIQFWTIGRVVEYLYGWDVIGRWAIGWDLRWVSNGWLIEYHNVIVIVTVNSINII